MSEYEELLKDVRWINRREQIIERSRRSCQICYSVDRVLQVHHLAYKSGLMPWEYEDNELVCLCDKCHEEHHRAVKWLQKQISELHPKQTIHGLRHDPHVMADLIAELAGRLAELSWCKVMEVPL